MKRGGIVGIAIFVTIVLFVVFIIYQQTSKQNDANLSSEESSASSLSATQAQGLGSLCSSQTICQQFCLNNRGLCTSYCDENPANALCLVLFDPESSFASSSSQEKKSNCISNPAPMFTHPFTDISKISQISQYGNNAIVNPGAQARSYVSVKEGESTPIYAPVNATLTKITYSNKFYTNLTRPEYRIDMQVSCEVRIAFDHVVSVVDFIKEHAPTVPANKSSEGTMISIPVQVGELLGYASGTMGGKGFDFFLINTAHKNQFINPSRWYSEHSLNKDCQYDYFPENFKQQYMTLIEEEKGVRSCGPRVKEVAGTPQGYWFQGNATETSGSRLAIYESKHFIEWTLLKGNETPVAYRTREKYEIYLDTLSEGKSACYFDKDKNVYLFLKMLPSDKLALVSSSGSCSSSFPQEFEIWER